MTFCLNLELWYSSFKILKISLTLIGNHANVRQNASVVAYHCCKLSCVNIFIDHYVEFSFSLVSVGGVPLAARINCV